jgi:hypothetical protein
MSEQSSIAHTTLRWGGSQTFAINPVPGEPDVVVNYPSKQLVALQWRWPVSWNVFTAIVPMFDPSEGATFTMSLEYVLGVGQGIDSFTRNFTIAPTAGVYPVSVTDQIFLPAQDIQITAVLSGKQQTAQPEMCKVAVWGAPQTEVHALLELLQFLRGEGSDQRQPQWMPPGFHPEPVHYRR